MAEISGDRARQGRRLLSVLQRRRAQLEGSRAERAWQEFRLWSALRERLAWMSGAEDERARRAGTTPSAPQRRQMQMGEQRGNGKRSKKEADLTWLFSRPTSHELLGARYGLDVYVKNAFRMLSLSATAPPEEIERAASRLAGKIRLHGAKALGKHAIALGGYEVLVEFDDPAAPLTLVKDPRRRLIYEVFWPCLPESVLGLVREQKSLVTQTVFKAIGQEASTTLAAERLLVEHAAAVCLHNQAISQEAALLGGHGTGTDPCWEKALKWWGQILGNPGFWAHLKSRVDAYDDFRVTREDVDALSEVLPAFVLGLNAHIAGVCSRVGLNDHCMRHVRLIEGSPFPAAAKAAALEPLGKEIGEQLLRPLVTKLKEDVTRRSGKLNRAEFTRLGMPLLDEAEKGCKFLRHTMKLDDETLRGGLFDEFVELFLDALNNKVDYQGDDNRRCVFLSLCADRRMRDFPLSTGLARKVEQNIRKDRGFLYPDDAKLPDDIDPVMCWFIPTEPADPDACVLEPVHQITDTSGGTIRWTTRMMLVPRSALARDFHNGKIKAKEVSERLAERAGSEVLDEINGLRTERSGVLAEIETEKQRALGQVERDRAERIRQLEASCTREQTEALRFVETKRGALEEKKKEADAAVAAKLAEFDQSQRKQLETLTGRYTALSRLFSFPSFCHLSPGTLAAVALGAAAAWLWGGALRLDAPQDLATTGALAGVLPGLMFSQLFRARRLRRLHAGLEGIGDQRKKMATVLHKERDKAVGVLERRFNEETAKARAVLGDIEKTRTGIEQDAKSRRDRAEQHARGESKARTSKLDAQIAGLEKRLEALKPKALNHKEEFPPLKNILRAGFKRGERPSQADIDRINQAGAERFKRWLNGLPQHEVMILQLLQQKLSSDQFETAVQKMMDSGSTPSSFLNRL